MPPSNKFIPTLRGFQPLTLQANGFSNIFTIQFIQIGGQNRFQIYDSTLNTQAITFANSNNAANGYIDIAAKDSISLSAPLVSFGGSIQLGYNAGINDNDGVTVLREQQGAVADASGGVVIDIQARAQLNALLAAVRAHGLIAT
jgi:hypothetical protein